MSTKPFVVGLLVLVFVASGTASVSSRVDEFSCYRLLAEMRDCSQNVNGKCDSWKRLIDCAKSVLSRRQMCGYDVIYDSVVHQFFVYNFTYNYFCIDAPDRQCCLSDGSKVSDYWMFLTPGFLTPKGCNFYRTYIRLIARYGERRSCYDMLYDYADSLFGNSTCEDVEIETPTVTGVRDLYEFFITTRYCMRHQKSLPSCTQKSNLLKCVERMVESSEIINPDVKTVEQNTIEIVRKSDEVICASEEVQSGFSWWPDCMNFLSNLFSQLRMQINGYLTHEGCEAVEFGDLLWTTDFYKEDCEYMINYWKMLRKSLNCLDIDDEVAVTEVAETKVASSKCNNSTTTETTIDNFETTTDNVVESTASTININNATIVNPEE